MISYNLKKDQKQALYLQLYNYIKEDIKSGQLKRNEKLPSKRNLAQNLGISNNTVSKAYEILIDEGYIYSKERVGFFVSNISNLASLNINISQKTYNRKDSKAHKNFKYDFSINSIDSKGFPRSVWRKLSSSIINNSGELLNKADKQGLFALRYDISRYLRQSRAVPSNPHNIIISSGTEYLMQILLYLLPSQPIFAIENPGYRDLNALLQLNNVAYNPIEVDSFGLDLERLKSTDSNIVLVTPSHQFPTGAIMPISRRLELLRWANLNNNNYIIEDDHDSEFKYYGKPIPALKSLDKLDNVIYIGNFSKSISPFLRVSYMLLPNRLMKDYNKKVPFLTCPVSNLTQLTLSKFMEEGYFERHLNRMRKLYNKKRLWANELLKDYPEKLEIIDSKAGLHFILNVKNGMSESQLIEAAEKESIFIQGLSSYYCQSINKSEGAKIIIGYGQLEKRDLTEGLERLLIAWEIKNE